LPTARSFAELFLKKVLADGTGRKITFSIKPVADREVFGYFFYTKKVTSQPLYKWTVEDAGPYVTQKSGITHINKKPYSKHADGLFYTKSNVTNVTSHGYRVRLLTPHPPALVRSRR